MSDQAKSTRLGDMLVERGIITRQQLREAIEIQQARHLLNGKDTNKAAAPLGEILIELGYLDQRQLKQTLSWQRRLRNATLVMSFVAPLLTTACGGGGGASAPAATGNNKTATSSSSLAIQEQSSSASSVAVEFVPSSTPVISSSSAISFSSPVSSSSNSSSSSNESNTEINGPVLLKWAVPSARENGEYLDVGEVGGYEIRYRKKGQQSYNSVRVEGGYVNNHYFNHLQGNLEFEIAAYDTNGLFSRFVAIVPQKNTSG